MGDNVVETQVREILARFSGEFEGRPGESSKRTRSSWRPVSGS